jgi:hypothetical protein
VTRPFREVIASRTPRRAVAIWAAAQAADLVMTLVLIAMGVAREVWPPAAFAYEVAGLWGIAVVKLVLIAATPLAVRIQPTPTWKARAWWFAAIGSLPVLVWNVLQIGGAL